MNTVKVIKIATALLIIIALALFMHRNLPRTAVVQITGTDIKRIDHKTGKHVSKTESSAEKGDIQTSDVRFINTVRPNEKVMVFRNEDTGWGWPPYFKFNSADVSAQAQAYATAEERPWVLVKYYGWRIRMFSMFPNALSLKVVDKDYSHFPLFNLVFLSLLTALIIYARFKFKKMIEWLRGKNLIFWKRNRKSRETSASQPTRTE